MGEDNDGHGASLSRPGARADASGAVCGARPPRPYTRDVFDEVAEVIEVIRPAIQADNGDVVLHGVDEATGVVTVELLGACVSCPASTVTLKAGLERILMDRVAGVTEVVDIGAGRHEIGGDGPVESPAAAAAAAAARPTPPPRETPVSL